MGPSAFPLTPLAYQVEPGAPADLQQLLLQTGPRSYALALWRNVSVWNTERLRVLHPASRIVRLALEGGAVATGVRDIGRRHPKPAAGASVALRLAGMPKVISITR